MDVCTVEEDHAKDTTVVLYKHSPGGASLPTSLISNETSTNIETSTSLLADSESAHSLTANSASLSAALETGSTSLTAHTPESEDKLNHSTPLRNSSNKMAAAKTSVPGYLKMTASSASKRAILDRYALLVCSFSVFVVPLPFSV